MTSPRFIGRYALYDEIASGGMATVHYARLLGSAGFSRTVAIKRLHPHFATDPEFVSMLLDEARLAARVRHPNVVQTLDVVAREGELFLVMEYIHGVSLAQIIRTVRANEERIPLDIASALLCGALHGLNAAHEAKSDRGEPLDLVHRDVSPQNIIAGADGIARMLDFGVAKAAGRIHTTQDGRIKGKLGYMAPEHLRGERLDRCSDVFSAGVVLWELLVLDRLFTADNEAATVTNVLQLNVPPPSSLVRDVPSTLDTVVRRALERKPHKRFSSAREMALALEACVPMASPTRIASWMEAVVGDELSERERIVARIEEESDPSRPSAKQHAVSTDLAPPSSSHSPRSSTIADTIVTQPWSRPSPSPGHVSPSLRRNTWVATASGAALLILAALFVTASRHSPTPSAAAGASATSEPVAAPPAPTPAEGVPSAATSASASVAASTFAQVAPPQAKHRAPATRPASPPCRLTKLLDKNGEPHFSCPCATCQ